MAHYELSDAEWKIIAPLQYRSGVDSPLSCVGQLQQDQLWNESVVRNIIDVHIGSRVAMLRAERGLTSHDVARCLKEMPRTYELRELGELRFSAEQLFTLAKTFGVDLKTIFDDQTGASGSYRLAARPTLRLVSSR